MPELSLDHSSVLMFFLFQVWAEFIGGPAILKLGFEPQRRSSPTPYLVDAIAVSATSPVVARPRGPLLEVYGHRSLDPFCSSS
jgi:hypothetical protein